MARQLWLLRHADAEPHGTRPDYERQLTQRGKHQAHIVGLAIAQMRPSFDGFLSSPKARARETAELACTDWESSQSSLLAIHEPLAAGFDAPQALDALSGLGADGRLLIVGHEPDLTGVVVALTGSRIDLKKGGLAIVRLEGSLGGELVTLLRPRELGLIAADPVSRRSTEVS
jgi:phosphohistidine phosphatase